jgi:hypothetical protein
MRRSRNIGYYERSRDASGRFVARADQEEVEETQPETQPLSAHGGHQISLSEEDTEQWEDVEDDDVSEQPAWDYSDFRRRSSILSGRLRAANNRGSAGTGQRRQPRPQPVAAMAVPPCVHRGEGRGRRAVDAPLRANRKIQPMGR